MVVLKFIPIALICLLACVLLKQIKPEFVPLVQISSLIILFVTIADFAKNMLNAVTEMIGSEHVLDDRYLFLLVRILGVSVVTKLSSDLCKDNGNSALATNVELVGKIIIFSMCLPLVKVIYDLAEGLLG